MEGNCTCVSQLTPRSRRHGETLCLRWQPTPIPFHREKHPGLLACRRSDTNTPWMSRCVSTQWISRHPFKVGLSRSSRNRNRSYNVPRVSLYDDVPDGFRRCPSPTLGRCRSALRARSLGECRPIVRIQRGVRFEGGDARAWNASRPRWNPRAEASKAREGIVAHLPDIRRRSWRSVVPAPASPRRSI